MTDSMNAYDMFYRHFLHPDSGDVRDGCPLDLVDKLQGSDVQRAEDELIRRVSTTDHWPAQALGRLKSKKALPTLRKVLKKAKGSVLAYTALSIWDTDHDPAMCRAVAAESRRVRTKLIYPFRTSALIDIAFCLSRIDCDPARKELGILSELPDYLVSYNARRLAGRPQRFWEKDSTKPVEPG